MGKKTIILHIGQSKTGTSSIQKFCQTNRQKLAAEGIIYPSVKKNGLDVNLLEHNAFAETLCGIQRYPYVQFEEYISQFQGDKILLSAESFFGVPHIWTLDSQDNFLSAHHEKLEKLREWTQHYNLEIILYLRHPLEWFKSSVAHIIRHEGLLGKKIYQSDEQLYELLKPHMDYVSLISLWNEVLQPDRFSIKAFDRSQLTDGDAVADFCNQIGYKGDRTKEFEENSGWPAEVTILKKEINNKPHSKYREWFMIDALTRVASKYTHSEVYNISPELQKRIIDDVAPMLKRLSLDYNIIFPEKNIKAQKEIDLATLDRVRCDLRREIYSMRGGVGILKCYIKPFLRDKCQFLYGLIKMIMGAR